MTVKLSVYLDPSVDDEAEEKLRKHILGQIGVDEVVTRTVDKRTDPDYGMFREETAAGPRGSMGLCPKNYKFVGYGTLETEPGIALHRNVSAMHLPGGFLVDLYEYVTYAGPGLAVGGFMTHPPPPEPGHRALFFLPVETVDDVRRAFFTGAD